MTRSRKLLLISVIVGVVSDLWPIPGALLAAVVFREGIHSSRPLTYIVLAVILNFLLFGGLTYLIAMNVHRERDVQTARPVHPVKGIIYTESELSHFRANSEPPTKPSE